MCVLMMLFNKDCYGYEASKTIGEMLEVKEGTVYLVLQRLEKTTLVDAYEVETDSQRKRKYYHLTVSGVKRMRQLIADYHQINSVIDHFINQTSKGDRDE